MNKNGFLLILFLTLFSIFYSLAQKVSTTSFYFDTDKSYLDDEQKELFIEFVKNIIPSEIISVEVIGYCDDRGREGYNDTLSLNRAKFIHNLLVNKGFLSEKIKLIKGKGSIELNKVQDIKVQRNSNRRADVIITSIISKITPQESFMSDTLKVGDKIVLENVLFENSRSILLKESIPVIERIASIVKERTKYKIAILGHICCNPPNIDVVDLETGLRNLSQARAKLIYDYFIYRGIDKNRLTFKGMMANYPLGKGEKFDRRVELLITGIIP